MWQNASKMALVLLLLSQASSLITVSNQSFANADVYFSDYSGIYQGALSIASFTPTKSCELAAPSTHRGKVLLVNLLEASKHGCPTKEPLTFTSLTLFSQALPAALVFSDLHNRSLEAYDYVFYPQGAQEPGYSTLVMGEAFASLLLLAEQAPNQTATITPEPNPFQVFFRSPAATFYRGFWLAVGSLYLLLWGLNLFNLLSHPPFSLSSLFSSSSSPPRLGLLLFLFLYGVQTLAFFSLGGDTTSLLKRSLDELRLTSLLLAGNCFLLMWLLTLSRVFEARTRILAKVGYAFSLISCLSGIAGVCCRLISYQYRGDDGPVTVSYALLTILSVLSLETFLLAAVIKVRSMVKQFDGLSKSKRALLRRFHLYIGAELTYILLTTLQIILLQAVNKRTLASFQVRIWLQELIAILGASFYLAAVFKTNRQPATSSAEASVSSSSDRVAMQATRKVPGVEVLADASIE